MRKKDEIKLDALSQLNDDVIEKVTRKRNKLMGKNRRPIKMIVPMAACLAGVLVLGAILGVLIPMLTKQVPIYTGMSVSTTSPIVEVRTSPAKGYSYDSLLAKKPGEEPTPPKKPVDDIAKSVFTVTGTDKDMYYAEPGQDIYITLHINNPDNFVILSFTLNGKVYSSYMFEEGSDMENIVLKYNVGNVEGIVEYTVDAIKYVDGKQIKDVLMNGERTVKVGVHTDKQPTVNASDIKVGIGSFAISASITDTLSLMSFETGKIYAGIFTEDELVTYKEITSPDGGRFEFDGLELAKDYRFAIVAAYDSLDGQGIALHTLYEYELTTLDVVGLDNIVPTQSGVDFSVIWEDTFENKKLDKIELYRGGELVRELSGDATAVTDLLSNNEYEIVLYYTRGGVQESVKHTFKTLEKAMPSITFGSFDSSTSSITGSHTIVDADNVITSDVAVGLYLNGQLVNNVQNQNPSWNELYSNTEYVVKASFAYNLNDGTGEHICEKELAVRTLEKTTPTLSFGEIDITDKYVIGDYQLNDPDSVIESDITIELYCNGELIGDTKQSQFAWNDLDSYTDYVLKASFTYDLDDGTGEHTYSVEEKIKTKPYLNVNSVTVLNTSEVLDGDKIFVKIVIDNPDAVEIKSVMINGIECNIIGGSTQTNLNVQIINDGQLGAGYVKLKVEALNTENYSYVETDEVSDEVLIRGTLELEQIQFVNSEYKPVNWRFEDETVYLMITVDNPMGYEIHSVTLENDNLVLSSPIKLDDNRYCFPYDHDGRWCARVKSIEYRDPRDADETPLKLEVNDTVGVYIETMSSDIIYISSPEDLLNISSSPDDNDRYYQLTCDIDMSGISWTPIPDFRGVLDGNGYTISNINIVGTSKREFNGLLFDKLWLGAVINLNLSSCNMFIDYNGIENNIVFAGLFAGDSEYGLIYNCTADRNSSIVAQTTVNNITVVGGIVGNINDASRVIDCINYASVSGNITGRPDVIGGIAGSSSGQIINCTNYGSVTALYNAGGIVSNASGEIFGCTNYGTVTGGDQVDGICATYGFNGVFASIKNCTNFGEVIQLPYPGVKV